MPVVMLMRCIVVAGAAAVEQSAREKNLSQSALPEKRFPSRASRRTFSLRIKNVFMHIPIEGGDRSNPASHLPSEMNPSAPKWFRNSFSATAAPGLRFKRRSDGYNLECLVRNGDVGAVAATWMASRQVDRSPSVRLVA
jgi:hypothetical protein